MPAVDWEGAVNARHLLGDIYRMGRSEWVTAAGWQQAYDDGIRTVVDLRNPTERGPRPTDPAQDRLVLERFTVLNCPTEEPDRNGFSDQPLPYLNHPRSYADYLRRFPGPIVGVLKTLATAPGAVVIHCSAGRDRTGLISTLLLLLAGVPEQVGSQYELGMRGINEWHRISPVRHPYERHLSADELEEELAGRLLALAQFQSTLNAEAFLRAHGLTDQELASLRRRLGISH
ncbi:MAG: protein tyrosine phosphatase [Micrococcaceae bacterium]|nr:protein tyrosine phosphatase [Micrococcaceae bacterium]